MGELLDGLNDTKEQTQRGNPCIVSKIRDFEGEERARDVHAVIVSPDRTTQTKRDFLKKHGYVLSDQTVRRHVRNSCTGCSLWLS